MEFIELNEEEYVQFQQSHPYANFSNSIESIRIREKQGWNCKLFGVKRDGKIVAATPLASTKIMKVFQYFDTLRGFLIDYEDLELLQFFSDHIKAYAKKNNGLFLAMSPHVVFQEVDSNGKPLDSTNVKQNIIDNLETVGFSHKGFLHEFNNTGVMPFEYSLYINGMNEEELLNHFTQPTRYTINKTKRQGVSVRNLNRDELDTFIDIVNATADKRGFGGLMREREHYYDMYDYYGDTLDVLMAYINTESFIENTLKEAEVLKNTIDETDKDLMDKPNNKKLLNKKKEFTAQYEANQKRYHEMLDLQKEYGKEIPLAVGMFLYYPYEVSYLFSGGVDAFMKYDGPYAIQWHTLQKAIQKGINHYNFYGFSGDFSKHANDRGVLEYKMGFNGILEQMIGEFVMPINEKAYALYKKIKKL